MTAPTISIRHLEPADGHHLRQLFEGLDEHDRYLRFLRSMPRIPAGVITALSNVDRSDHVAVGAFDGGRCVGAARYIRDRHRPHLAELAVTVARTHRRRGLAASMVQRLQPVAAGAGIAEFEVSIHPMNRAATAMARRFGCRLVLDGGDLVGRLDVAPVALQDPWALAMAARARSATAGIGVAAPMAASRS